VKVAIGIPEEHVKAPVLDAGLEAVTRLNEDLIRSGQSPTFGQAVAAGVVWKAEPPGEESFDHGAKVAARGWGDCDDLAPLHAASLRVSGRDKGARAVVYRSGPHRWHAIVQRSNGAYEDPSRTAGMPVREATCGIPAAVVGCLAGPASVGGPNTHPHVSIAPSGVGYAARCDVPIAGGRGYALAVKQSARKASVALGGAVLGAAMLSGCSGCIGEERLRGLYAMSGLLSGKSPRHVANVVGREMTEKAVQTLLELCPAILDELRAHRKAVEDNGGGPQGGTGVAGGAFH
jgi:hypothetical protein